MTLGLHSRRRGGRRPVTSPAASSPRAGRAASCTPSSPTASTRRRPAAIDAAERDQARDGPPGLRQGLPPLRRGAAAGARSTRSRRRSTWTGCATTSTTRRWRSSARPATTATAPSTPSASCPTLALERGVGLHVDGCLGGFILPFGRELGYDIPAFDYRVPGRDLHLGRHPQVRLRLQGLVGAQLPLQGAAQRAVLLPDRLERREVHLPGHGGLALGRPDRRHLGRHGAARPRRLPAATPGRSSRRPSPCRRR